MKCKLSRCYQGRGEWATKYGQYGVSHGYTCNYFDTRGSVSVGS